MLLEHERNYDLGMDALVSVCSWNTNGIMIWAWMLWSADALRTRRELWFGHGCLVSVCSWNTNEIMVWARMLWSAEALGPRTVPARALGAPGAKLLVSPVYNNPYYTPIYTPLYNPPLRSLDHSFNGPPEEGK